MSPPLLAASDLRVDVRGVPALDRLTFATTADRALLLGAPRALFEAASGIVRPSRGTLSLRGVPAAEALASADVASAPRDPAFPADWSVRTYVTWNARLAGLSRGDATPRVNTALERMGLRTFATHALKTAPLALRRATVLAGALATGARVIVLEDPFGGLEDEAAAELAKVTVRALHERDWLLFAARAPLGSALVAAADEALVVSESAVIEQGRPSVLATRSNKYAVDVYGDGEALAVRIKARGASVESLVAGANSARFTLELPEGASTRDLFVCAEEVGAIVVELRPISRAFA